jgi:ubiquinone/menaquinone biosynthesis C-methylase UbiE
VNRSPVSRSTDPVTAANEDVRAYWEPEPCGTSRAVVGDLPGRTREWFEEVERFRYEAEPFIHSVAQFTRHSGKTILEIGVGAGTDHLQWARAGCRCFGVDLTDSAIETTRTRLSLYGFSSELQRIDAEELPYRAESFDVVYSWGVIHHSARPERIVSEIHRVLRPGGVFIGMMYSRRSVTALRFWVRFALLGGRPWRTIRDVMATHVESAGTKAYTIRELRQLFSAFRTFSARPMITVADTADWPRWISQFFPDAWGWFIALRAER